jgi:hypothetical protein
MAKTTTKGNDKAQAKSANGGEQVSPQIEKAIELLTSKGYRVMQPVDPTKSAAGKKAWDTMRDPGYLSPAEKKAILEKATAEKAAAANKGAKKPAKEKRAGRK